MIVPSTPPTTALPTSKSVPKSPGIGGADRLQGQAVQVAASGPGADLEFGQMSSGATDGFETFAARYIFSRFSRSSHPRAQQRARCNP